MSNEIIFITQIGSILGFIVSLFVLYRLLVNQKDATIELLKEKIALLEKQVESLKESSPDVLLDSMGKRINHLTNEITRLSEDREANKEVLLSIQNKVKAMKDEFNSEMDMIEEFLEGWEQRAEET